ncbi:MAG: DUF4230 domain-containing protein [Eubacteriales bacterium]|nr:DUF4230 domain-containing protein [Eubacteriales bacterium]
MEEKQTTVTGNKILKRLSAIILVILVIVAVVVGPKITSKKDGPEIISKATLERIINISDLSTFEAVYNGVAKVMNEKKPENIDYYVSYNAKVKAGLDFEKVDLEIDKNRKVITVKLPEIKITDVNVDIASLDYIFVNDKANTETVSAQAYEKCIEDVTNKSAEEEAIYTLAEQNAHNIIEALISPFVKQLDEEYQLVIK